ncbi:MAG: CopG family transcriptional regulator [Hyphomicrobiales bacterium]|nr:CopG family transcriptional regulator [Hyphomicrobiales bacterium]
MKKDQLSVYLDPEVMTRLIELAGQKNQPKSVIAEAAIASFVTPDDSDRREAALVRRLDLLTRQGERLERDLSIAAEAIALFIKFWLTVTPPLPESAQAAAQAKGRERYEFFLETLGRRLAKGQGLLREVSTDMVNGASNESEGRSTVQLRSHEAPR